ncbi:hypothetical protein [Blackfly microvirus SF02]|uniref:Uncharacterized protein n=1 Tax=Blackfly microvirus SF02 TaxID=2576452 RepID=A0A4P8PJV6_9VIRU|nr:hypothetical protein [Blackfly microvirus SF02]
MLLYLTLTCSFATGVVHQTCSGRSRTVSGGQLVYPTSTTLKHSGWPTTSQISMRNSPPLLRGGWGGSPALAGPAQRDNCACRALNHSVLNLKSCIVLPCHPMHRLTQSVSLNRLPGGTL